MHYLQNIQEALLSFLKKNNKALVTRAWSKVLQS
jgi:hypothetical protein